MRCGSWRGGAIVALACASCLTAPAGAVPSRAGTHTAAPADSLYARMGGAPVVRAVVSDMFDRVVVDPRINPPFQGVDIKRLKRLVAEQICVLAGGGCRYDGDSMRDAHAGLHITQREFDGMVEILRASLRRHHVGLRERNELLAILAPLERDVVEVPAPPAPPRPKGF